LASVLDKGIEISMGFDKSIWKLLSMSASIIFNHEGH
jgi:hypothetical protein